MNKWLDKMERRYGRFGIPNLMTYITATMLVVYLFGVLVPQVPLMYYIQLYFPLVMRGQVWRLLTFIFMPPASGSLFIFISLYFYYWIGSLLESNWGTFRFNVYYLCGMLGAILSAVITGYGTNTFLNMSLFLAVAAIYPDMEVLLFFVIPIKIKYIAYLDLAYYAYLFIIGGAVSRLSIVFSLLNFLLFFGPDFFNRAKNELKYRKVRKNFRENNDYWR